MRYRSSPAHITRTLLARFFHSSIAGGVSLFVAAVLAMLVANTAALASVYAHALHADIGFVLGDAVFSFSIQHFVNDGLMAVFFLLVGLEIKRELCIGEISTRESATLPAVAAAGGMLVPALIYSYFNWGDANAMRGWAIPTATDIAFSLGVLSLLGSRVPVAIKVFLTAVAVLDDLGAIAIIALFYTDTLHIAPLAGAVVTAGVLLVCNRRGVYALTPYLLGFIVLWVCLLQSGVHATLAGVITAFAVPLKPAPGHSEPTSPEFAYLEHRLHTPVTFIILPLFAFVNAGVSFSGFSFASLAEPIPAGIAIGLIVGKVVGISTAVWLAVRLHWSVLPHGSNWHAVIGVALLCGIGFTVSLFIGNLSFTDAETINAVKIGVFTGSAIAGVLGYTILHLLAPPKPAQP